MSDKILDQISCSRDLKGLSSEELTKLCEEIREKIITTVSKNGGHLASNLGVVELTVALHTVFECPKDQIVWDVGHQCYTHKMLTGRLDKIDTIRTKGGLSGFQRRDESICDPLSTGHSSTSISSAFGLATAKNLKGEDGSVIAVIGDGALSGGLAYEGMNNAGSFKRNFIVILNDNKMSISRNVGSMARYLSAIRMRSTYLKAKNVVDAILVKIPVLGDFIKKIILKSKSALKKLINNGTIFEGMGFKYFGPIDGHDVKKLIKVLTIAKNWDRPILIHINTVKGKGYHYAEKNPKAFHGTSGFDVKNGLKSIPKSDFSSVFGRELFNLAKDDDRICAITAAMKLGTGLSYFARTFKNRFFDVGIAEEHAVTFAGGLSAGGMLPVFAVYSTFFQRSYDQLIHDVSLQDLKVVFAIDRAGIVGEDGETHQGIFDVALLNTIPGSVVYAPSYFDEVSGMLKKAFYEGSGIAAVRYPRGAQLYKPVDFEISDCNFDLYGESSGEVLIITYGRLFSFACMAKHRLLKDNEMNVSVLKLNKIKPIDSEAIKAATKFKNIFFFEEGIKNGGVAERFECELNSAGFKGEYTVNAIDDKFVRQATVKETLQELMLDDDGMKKIILQGVNNFVRKEKIGRTAV